jgi:PAS domain S-box-containing protein
MDFTSSQFFNQGAGRPPLRVGAILDGPPGGALLQLIRADLLHLRAVCLTGGAELGKGEWLDAILVNTPSDLHRMRELDVILNLSTEPDVTAACLQLPPSGIPMLDSAGLVLLERLARAERELLQVTVIKEQFDAILCAAQEGIQLADKDGILQYVNPAFTTITGVPPEQRVGFSVFDVSPDGALAEVLRTGAPVTGLRNMTKNSNAEVVSNASPLVVGGEIVGAVCVFRDITPVFRLSRQLNESNVIINTLNERLTQLQRAQYSFADIVGQSPCMQQVLGHATRAANSGSTVLILGESGTGKELFAHAIHQASRRSGGPFVVLNAVAIPEDLLESELFGHEKGAFTGALRTKIGRFELAHGGTLFLDEIGDMSINLQAKLLRILQEQRFERVGGVNTIRVDVRIITATNRDLRRRIQEGLFREDLFYRLNVMRVEIPSLRERSEDIPMLVRNLLQKLNRKLGTQATEVEERTWKLLLDHNWPGNVRELENLLERAVNLAEGSILPYEPIARHVQEETLALAPVVVTRTADIPAPPLPLAEMERRAINEALDRFGTTLDGKKKVAQSLGISLSTLYARLKVKG